MRASLAALFAILFLALSGAALWAMLRASTRRNNPSAHNLLVQIHRFFGYAFLFLFCLMVYFMAMRLRGLADPLSPLVTAHMSLASLLAPLLLVKVLIARYFKQYSQALLPLGLSIFAISFALVTVALLPHYMERAEAGHLPAIWSIALLPVFLIFLYSAVFRSRSARSSDALGFATATNQSGASLPPSPSLAPAQKSPLLLRLAHIEQQGDDARTLRFVLPRGARIEAKPGQFLTFRWNIGGRIVPRSYSICSSPSQSSYIEITPKRVPNGVVSSFLNDYAAPGLAVEADGPFGNFFFDEEKHSSLVLIAAGSGITPMISMLRYIEDRCLAHQVTLLFFVRKRQDILFLSEFKRLSTRLPHFRLAIVLTQPDSVWSGLRGRISDEIISSHCPDLPASSIFLCGPGPFMDRAQEILRSLGVHPDQVNRESFGSAGEVPVALRALPTSHESTDSVEFVRSRKSCAASGSSSILELAEAAGLSLPYSCRAGQCGTCATRLLSGEVEMSASDGLDETSRAAGLVLICVGRAKGKVKLDA